MTYSNNSYKKLANHVKDSSQNVVLTWENLSVYYEHRRRNIFKCQSKLEKKWLLRDVSGICSPGTITSVIGLTASGKSLLLSTLAGYLSSDLKLKGDIKINGQRGYNRITSRQTVYVENETHFIPSLKVQEHMNFYATLLLPHLSKADKQARIEKVLCDFGLTKCTNTFIGDGLERKGISGGECKRLALASLFLVDATLLIMDEPTSGLDSFMAENVMKILRTLAEKGKTVLCSLQQPTSDVSLLIDRVCILSQGEQVFFGSSLDAIEYYNTKGLMCPANVNPFDHFVYCLREDESSEIPNMENLRRFKKSSYQRTVISEIDLTNDVLLGRLSRLSYLFKSTKRASWFVQFCAIFWQTFLVQSREKSMVKARMFQILMIAAFQALIFFDLEITQRGIRNISSVYFLFTTAVTYGTFYAGLATFLSERKKYFQEQRKQLYSVGAYFWAKNLLDLISFSMVPFCYVTVAYWCVKPYGSFSQYLLSFVVGWLISMNAIAFSYFCSTVTSNVDLSMTISVPLLFGFMVVAGLQIRLNTIPVAFQWFKWVSWFFYGFEVLMYSQWFGYRNIPCNKSSDVHVPCLQNGTAVLHSFGFYSSCFECIVVRDLVLLALLAIFYRFLAYVCLRRRKQ